MRKFSLISETGERFGLNGEHGVYFSNPAGLGFSVGAKYSDLGSGFFVNKKDLSMPQGNITGELVFTRNPYSGHESFNSWLSRAGELRLAYNRAGMEYVRKVEISYITKTEIGKGGWLHCPISLLAMTPWYLPTAQSVRMAQQPSAAARYGSARYSVARYGIKGGDMSAIINPGSSEAALLIKYTGAVTNPVITVTGTITGKVYGRCAVTGSISDTDTLVLSTAFEDSYIHKISSDGTITDLLNSIDVALNPFPHIPTTEDVKLTITADSVLTGTAEATVYYYKGAV